MFKKNEEPKKVVTRFVDEGGNLIKEKPGTVEKEEIPDYTYLKTEKDKDGKQFVIKTKDGDQPKEDIDGYDFEKTEKDENNGDVIHVYKTKAKVADKKEAVKTGASAGKIILPVVGLAGLGGLVSFAARKRFKKNNK